MTRDELLKKICPWGTCDCGDDYESCNCDDCNRVLEEWLYDYEKHVIEQYKADTNLKDTIREIHDNVANEMYCKAIDEFVKKICEKYTEEERKGNYKQYCCEIKQNIADIAEQLKAGEHNAKTKSES